MGIEENKEIVRRFVERTGKGDSSAINDMTTDDFVLHALIGEGMDVDKDYYIQTNDGGHVGFPDYTMTIDYMVAEDNHVTVISTRRGTNKGEFLTIPPTGNQIKVFRFALYRLENGIIAEMWAMDDYLAQFQQLGLLPSREVIIQNYKDSLK